MKNILYLTQILVILFFQSASAKRPFDKKSPVISPWEIGFSSGVSIFVTSVNPEPAAINNQVNYWHNSINPGVGLFAVGNISPAIGVEVNWLNTRLTGKWDNKYPPHLVSVGRENPLTYNSQINQFDLMLVINVDQMMLPGDPEDSGHFFIKTGIGFSEIKDNKKFYPGITYARISYALGAGYSVSLNEKLKLQIGSTFRSVNTDNLDGVHVVVNDKNGQLVHFMKIFEIYNYSYLSVSYRIGNFGSSKYRLTFKRPRWI
jgi:hypothetical protein